MSNLNKKSVLDSVKKAVFDNKVILLFVVMSILCMLIADTNVAYVASEVASRLTRNACIVLALIIPCMAGLGMNFGIVVGAIAAQISIFWIVHWGFTGITGFLLTVLMSTPLALLFGWLLGKFFNKTKGAEMIAGLVLGFFAAGVYRLFVLYIMGGVIPFDDPNLLDRGFGLRNAFDLTGNLKYALDDISFLATMAVIGAVTLVSNLAISLHAKKNGKAADPKLAVKLIGSAALLVVGIVGKFIPFVNNILGGTRVIMTNGMILLGAILIVLGAVKFLTKSAPKSKAITLAVLGVLAIASTFIPAVAAVYKAVRLPAMTIAIIYLFAGFNTWLVNTRLGQNMRTVGQSRSVATSAGINVDKTRVIATCISTVLAAWGQLIFLQNLGTFNTVQQQDNVGLYAVAAILVGGANVQKANNKQAIIGVLLFHTLFVVAPLAATKLVGDSAISEYIRMFFSYGVITVSLAMHAWKKVEKRKPGAEGLTRPML